MVASEIRALFAVAARPEVVLLAGGMPYISALPLDAVGEMAGQLVADRGAVALQYGSGQGDPGLREGICEVMSLEGIRAHPDEVVVTVGSQQAFDLITRIFVDPGDVVLAEGPSYVGALGTFASYEADVVHVPIDDDGLIPGALASVLAQLAAAGRRAKFLYTCPSFHNPAGADRVLHPGPAAGRPDGGRFGGRGGRAPGARLARSVPDRPHRVRAGRVLPGSQCGPRDDRDEHAADGPHRGRPRSRGHLPRTAPAGGSPRGLSNGPRLGSAGDQKLR